MKACRQSVEITVSRDSEVSPTLAAQNSVSNSAGCLNSLQTVKAKAVQIRKQFWIRESVGTHGTAYIVQKGFDI